MKRAQGFSLIELMLALALGVVVTAGIVALFVGNNQTYTLLNGQSRMQENARFAVDFISRSARAAGYFGCDPEPGKIYKTLNGAWNQIFEFDITTPIQAFHGTGGGNTANDWTPALTTLPRTGSAVGYVPPVGPDPRVNMAALRPLSDVLVLRHVQVPGARIAAIVQANADPTVEVPPPAAGGLGFTDDNFVAINNCEQATVFRIATVTAPGGPAATLRLSGPQAMGNGLYQNALLGSLSPTGIPYGEANNAQGASVGRVLTDIYYVAQGTGTNNRNQTPWSLWRKTSEDAPVELIEGIESLRVRFGIDTTPNDNVNSTNRYVTYDQVGANRIQSLRVSVIANSVDVVTDGAAAPLSRTFSQTITFRN
jgi:type IV pilus assembly protein PilW